jgi:hypothetical protein
VKATVKVEMFKLPNFMRIAGMGPDAGVLDVGHLFPTDTAAEDFWNESRRKWVEHVAKRRNALTVSGDACQR